MRISAVIGICLFLVATITCVAYAQPRIARIQPDAIAPGMTITLEILSFESHLGAFGEDGFAPNDIRLVLNNPDTDSDRVIFGPHVVSWGGRLIQVPVLVPFSANEGFIEFHVERGVARSDTVRLRIQQAVNAIDIIGSGLLGVNSLTAGNTLILRSLDLGSSNPLTEGFRFAVTDTDGNPINQRLHPMTILSLGPVRIHRTTLSVSADTINGGPGGGGGGAGHVGVGGYGYTGGGSCDTEFVQPATNVGSGFGPPSSTHGGASSTGVRGGQSDNSDQGGAGGTGNPFGSSGSTGARQSPSFDGGYGGGSAGGENPAGPYGGGGGGFATKGEQGTGLGDNGGKANGGRFLAPMMGGSGGGAGNSFERFDTLEAGNGGGGGGAMTIISYHSLTIDQAARIEANGANGSAGHFTREGGGGGGSGGGIILASRTPFDMQGAIISARNGSGAPGGGAFDSSAHGGNGGLGRIRIDAPVTDTCTSCTGSMTYGPTITVPTAAVTTPGVKLSGFAGIGTDLTDSIRIYYRTRHSNWTRADTVRKKSGNVFIWEKTIPAPLDSLLFVCVYAQVNKPQSSFANYEPGWLTGHLASGIIPIRPGSDLVVSPDSLNVGCTKIGTCLEGLVYIENRGEALLTIDTIYTEPPIFTIKSAPTQLLGYDPKSITIEYCPQAIRADTAQLIIIAGGQIYRKTILTGCGLDKDRRILALSGLDFGRRHIDEPCRELSLVITSDGDDSVTIDLGNLFRPPFEVIDPDTSIILLGPRGDKANVTIRFCPSDSGSFSETFIITERRDSFVVRGVGTRRILFAPDTFSLGEYCLNTCVDTGYTIYSVGNDPFKLDKVIVSNGLTIIHPTNPQIIQENERILFRVCFDSVGEHFAELTYGSDADSASSVRKTIIHYKVNGLAFAHDSVFDLGASCTGSCDSLSASIRNLSSAFTISSINLHDTIFTLTLPPSMIVGENESFNISLRACPPTEGKYFDTLTISFTQGECDSTIHIPVHVTSADAALTLSANTLDFDIVDSGACLRDTVSLANPCESAINVTLPTRSGVFTRIEPATSQVTIPGGSALELIYEFCPLDSNFHAAEDTILYNGTSVRLSLTGKGRVIEDLDPPVIHFALDHIPDGIVPETFEYIIEIDSVFNGNAISAITAVLRFDPLVVLPMPLESNDGIWQLSGSELQPGLYRIDAIPIATVSIGPFAIIPMQALRSRRDSTSVVITASNVTPQGTLQSDTGSIKTNACALPPPNIIIPGQYMLGDPTPNPLRSKIFVPIMLGAEHLLDIRLYNAQGTLVRSLREHKAKGTHEVALDVSGLPPGLYILEAESFGWRDHKNILIVK